MSSVFGKNINISIFGQSHSKAIGVCIDNLPAGFKIDMQELNTFMQKRSAVNKSYATKRKEPDKVEFVSGIINDTTCGAPVCALIYNTDYREQDYENIKKVPRPSHADYTGFIKFKGYQDPTGGGHFSGRITAALCIAGEICKQILEKEGISIYAHIQKIYDLQDEKFAYPDYSEQTKSLLNNDFPVIDKATGQLMQKRIIEQAKAHDSLGGIIECMITGLPAGIGDPIFDGLENNISKSVFAVPAIKGIEFGNGFSASSLFGSQNNDEFVTDGTTVKTTTNNHGGILGGISSGMPLVFRVAVKPTASIGLEQNSVNLETMQNEKLVIQGRHDPCIVPRAVPCIQAAAAIAVLDLYMSYKIWR